MTPGIPTNADEFLKDPDTYRTVQQYWEALVENVAAPRGQSGHWQPWLQRHYADGTPFDLEDVPILDGRSHLLNRGLMILQHPAEGEETDIVAWVDRGEEQYADALPAATLVLNLSLTEASARIAEALLSKWMDPLTSVPEMKAFIREIGAGGSRSRV